MNARRKLAALAVTGGILAGGVALAAPASALSQTGCTNEAIVLWTPTAICYGGSYGGLAVAVTHVEGVNFYAYGQYSILMGNTWVNGITGGHSLTPSSPQTVHEMWWEA